MKNIFKEIKEKIATNKIKKEHNQENNLDVLNDKINFDETEDDLFKKYGTCTHLKNNSVKVLFIANTHNELANEKDLLVKEIKKIRDYDACILLGGHSQADIESILKYVSKDKIYGILGNHDDVNLLLNNNIQNINGQVIQIKNLKIAAIQGYNKNEKENNSSISMQEENIKFADSIKSGADILISHSKPFTKNTNNESNDGLKGITHYIYKNHVPIHIYAHMHESSATKLKNDTKSFCIHNVVEINFNNL